MNPLKKLLNVLSPDTGLKEGDQTPTDCRSVWDLTPEEAKTLDWNNAVMCDGSGKVLCRLSSPLKERLAALDRAYPEGMINHLRKQRALERSEKGPSANSERVVFRS